MGPYSVVTNSLCGNKTHCYFLRRFINTKVTDVLHKVSVSKTLYFHTNSVLTTLCQFSIYFLFVELSQGSTFRILYSLSLWYILNELFLFLVFSSYLIINLLQGFLPTSQVIVFFFSIL